MVPSSAMTLSTMMTTPSGNLINGSGHGMMVVEPSKMVVPIVPLMDHVFLPTFNIIMELFHEL
jgi:hypothetical protein